MAYSAWLQCMNGCEGRRPVTSGALRCERCGGLLDVEHDMTALADRSAEAWKSLFDGRLGRAAWPGGSGVWSKREWVMPMIGDDDIVSLAEGANPLIHARRYGQQLGLDEVWVKMCGQSHTGSFKDLGMTVLVSVVKMARREGASIRAVACASTGDTSAALAAYGASAGLPVVVLLPRGKVSTAQLVQPLANGARVLAIDSDFDGCMALVQQLAADGHVYLANSMNPLRIEGQKTVGIEIVQQFDWQVPDWVIIPGGNLGNAYALYRGLEQLRTLGLIARLPRLCVAQARAANPLYRAFRDRRSTLEPITAASTLATAIQIGNPVSFPRAMRALEAMNGVVEDASEDELAEAAARADRTGLYACPHTAVALAALEKLAARGDIKRTDRAVVVSTANGLKFTEFKVRYHERALPGLSSSQANAPVMLAPRYADVLAALDDLPPTG